MQIGDDWFTRSMLMKTISQTAKVGQGAAMANPAGLFAEVFNQFLLAQIQTDGQTSSQTYTTGLDGLNLFSEKKLNFISDQIEPLLNESSSQTSGFRFSELDSEKINQYLGGKLSGMGDVFVRAGQRYNIDPALLAAIAQHETGNGKSHAAEVKNNIAGMMGKNGLKSYSTVEESIMDMARNLSENYLDSGLTSISKIAAKYAPIGASNDPNGLNNHWVSGVTKYFGRLRN